MEILNNGKLIVDGGDGVKGAGAKVKVFGRGTGGVIQIISPVGNLSAHSLSLRPGDDSTPNSCDGDGEPIEANGYHYLRGMVYNGRFNLDNFLNSSKLFSGISEPGYF